MKRLIAIVLSIAMILTGCAAPSTINSTEQTESAMKTEIVEVSEPETVGETQNTEPEPEGAAQSISFSGLDDPVLLTYVENTVYEDLISELNSDEYFVEKMEAVYLSKEYIEELAYNSQSNVFFGYTIEELEEEFQGKRYVFTLDDDGQTTVVELEEVYDDTYDQVIKNAVIGNGVILVCVTVSVATTSVTPAVSMIFAASAATGTMFALESGAISFAAASLARGYQTHDFNEALKAGTLAASDGFKWGAIIGAATGGVVETLALKGATLNGLTMNEAAAIQRESKWPLDAIKSFHSTKEYKIYKDANLVPMQFSDGTWAFIRKINWNTIDSYGRTNAQRVARGLAPIDLTGKPYELHHIGQKADSPLAILTYAEHHSSSNYSTLHYAEEGKNVADDIWATQKKEFWNAILKMAQEA